MSAAAPGPGTQAKWGQRRRRRRAELMFNGRVSQHSEDLWLSPATLRGIQSFDKIVPFWIYKRLLNIIALVATHKMEVVA